MKNTSFSSTKLNAKSKYGLPCKRRDTSTHRHCHGRSKTTKGFQPNVRNEKKRFTYLELMEAEKGHEIIRGSHIKLITNQ